MAARHQVCVSSEGCSLVGIVQIPHMPRVLRAACVLRAQGKASILEGYAGAVKPCNIQHTAASAASTD